MVRWVAAAAIAIVGCGREPQDVPGDGSSDLGPELTSFGFLAANNPALSTDLVGLIGPREVNVTVPAWTDTTALVATFTTNTPAIVQLGINGPVQVSGQTANDFTAAASLPYDVKVGAASTLYQVALHGGSPFTAAPPVPTPAPVAIGLADFNGDGRPDLVTSGNLSVVAVSLNTTSPRGVPSFADAVTFPTESNSLDVVTADFNGDGRPDIASPNLASSTVSVLLDGTVQGSSTPLFTAHADFAVGPYPIAIAAGDLDGDGRPDLVTASTGNRTVSVMLDTTAPGATSPSFAVTTIPLDTSTNTQDTVGDVQIGDVDGDGKPDIVATTPYSGWIWILHNTTPSGATTPTFAIQQALHYIPSFVFEESSPAFVAIVDLDRDGRQDLVVADQPAQVLAIYMNTTPGQASSSTFAPVVEVPSADPHEVVIADIDRDGISDLVLANYGGAVGFLRNTTALAAGTPHLVREPYVAIGTETGAVAVGDLNADGVPDVAATDYYSGTDPILMGQP